MHGARLPQLAGQVRRLTAFSPRGLFTGCRQRAAATGCRGASHRTHRESLDGWRHRFTPRSWTRAPVSIRSGGFEGATPAGHPRTGFRVKVPERTRRQLVQPRCGSAAHGRAVAEGSFAKHPRSRRRCPRLPDGCSGCVWPAECPCRRRSAAHAAAQVRVMTAPGGPARRRTWIAPPRPNDSPGWCDAPARSRCARRHSDPGGAVYVFEVPEDGDREIFPPPAPSGADCPRRRSPGPRGW